MQARNPAPQIRSCLWKDFGLAKAKREALNYRLEICRALLVSVSNLYTGRAATVMLWNLGQKT